MLVKYYVVLVQEPWPMPHILAPKGSNVEINCIEIDTDDSPFWSINLATDSSTAHLQFTTRKDRLNNHGVYELSQTETPLTLRLLINDTAINNQTEIICERGAQSTTTVLYVFGEFNTKSKSMLMKDTNPTDPIKIPLTLKVLVVDVSSVNLTWDLSVGDAAQTFSLTIISNGSIGEVIPLNKPHYHFTAPEGAPPCEVYNFSVTATYVGATYTGAGCSVSSIVNNVMLPSLPNIGWLESSVMYSLVLNSQQFIFNISFEVSYASCSMHFGNSCMKCC
jgi:hypothetical protein